MGFNDLSQVLGLFILLFVGLGFLIAGIFFIYSDYSVLKSWKPIKAIVVNSFVESDYDSDGYLTYFPCVNYKYTFKEITGTGLWCNYSSSDEQSTQKMLTRYFPGSGIDILVDQKKPQNSRVKSDINPFNEVNLIFTGFGVVFTICSAAAIYFLWYNHN